ncbi:MAG: YfiR family protein, partial [Acidobacteria bacterium]|nr:YfiR family protein [Acidobacteriota bacterium]
MGFLNPSRDCKAEGPKSWVGVSLALWKTVALWLLLAGVCFISALPAQAQTTTSLEYQVKAAFLLNFTKFVEWPSAAFSTFNSPIRICVLGEDPFGPTLNRTLAGEIVNNRSLEAARLSSSGNLRDCHVLFISRSERGRVAQILSGLRGSSVLTVSEVPGFTDAG